jgi:hypothetical protein
MRVEFELREYLDQLSKEELENFLDYLEAMNQELEVIEDHE